MLSKERIDTLMPLLKDADYCHLGKWGGDAIDVQSDLLDALDDIAQLEAELANWRKVGSIDFERFKKAEAEYARLRETDTKSIELLIGWLTNEDDVDMIIHTDRYLRERCNCENELPPCKICEALEGGDDAE